MSEGCRKKSQVSVGLTEDEKVVLGKQSFKQNRSVSQIIRFAVKKYLDGLRTPAAQPIQAESTEELFTKLGTQLAKNADILNSLRITLIELRSDGVGHPLHFNYFSDNATSVTGYDKFDLLDNDFFYSRIHPDDLTENLINQSQLSHWENLFRFKVANGKYFNTRITLKVMTERRIIASWQFLDQTD
jgi:hypothetical protein